MLKRILDKVSRHFRRYESEQDCYVCRLKDKNKYINKVV